MTIGDRIRELSKAYGGQEALGEKVGLTRWTIAEYIAGKSSPKIETIEKLADVTGCDIRWLLFGDEQAKPSPPKKQAVKVALEIAPGLVAVPQYKLQASAGPGAFAENQEEVDVFYMAQSWLSQFIPKGASAAFIQARGDSMSPTIRDGDLMLVSFYVTNAMIDDGGVFIVTLGGMIVVKRLQRMRDRSIRIISDNPRYEAEVITDEEAANGTLVVNAKVVWSGGPLRD